MERIPGTALWALVAAASILVGFSQAGADSPPAGWRPPSFNRTEESAPKFPVASAAAPVVVAQPAPAPGSEPEPALAASQVAGTQPAAPLPAAASSAPAGSGAASAEAAAAAVTEEAAAQPAEALPAPASAPGPDPLQMPEFNDRFGQMQDMCLSAPALAKPVPGATPAAPGTPGCGKAVAPAAADCECSKCAGYDKGFYIRTLDKNFMLKVNALMQARYVADWRHLDPPADEDEFGFVLERAPVIFSGNIIDPKWTYWMILQASPSTGTEFLEEARINYEFDNGVLMQLGRFRNPAFMRETDVSYARQMAVERSYQYAIFNTGLDEGICLSKQNDIVRGLVFINDGRNSGAPTATKDFFEDMSDFAISAGVDWKLAGDWAQYGDFASWPDEPFAAFIGADIYYETGETGDNVLANNDNKFIAWTVDGTIEDHGAMAFGSVVKRYSLVPGEEIHQTGFHAMAAYQIVPEKIEPFIRYEFIDFDGVTSLGSARTPVADSTVNIAALGVNRYFKRHSAKLTTEIMYAFDPIPVAAPATGFLLDASNEPGQTVLRTQLQLFF
ncbi:MAG: hypothetical protein U0805_11700 [Pirellulales bacterium]